MRSYSLLVLLVCAVGPAASGGDFYQQFLSLIDTNRPTQRLRSFPILVDTNNTGMKATNAVLDLAALKQSGDVAGVRLGMTMQEVVDRWGKPQGGWSRCMHGLITFFYSDVALGFEADRLETIRIIPHAKFVGGLSTVSKAEEFIRVLGSPPSRPVSESYGNVIYLSPSTSLRLQFREQELIDIWLERTPSRAEPWQQTTGANYPAAGNARSVPEFAFACQWPGVPEPTSEGNRATYFCIF